MILRKLLCFQRSYKRRKRQIHGTEVRHKYTGLLWALLGERTCTNAGFADIGADLSAKMTDMASEFPDDENGDVLRRMLRNGDDCTKPRDIDFSVVFPSDSAAVKFADHFERLV